MFESFAQVFEVQGPFIVPVASVFFAAVAIAVILVAREVRKVATHRMDLEAKREMMQQGATVEEIERVLKAGRD